MNRRSTRRRRVPYAEVTARDRNGSADVCELSGALATIAQGTRPLVILVHGFANSEDAARRSYERLLDRLGALMSSGLGGRADVVALHWPGDHPLRLLNVPTFSVRVPAANETGRLLGEALAASSRPRVVVVAHSLGGRVVMAALDRLRTLGHAGGRPPVDAVLLAAAVPVRQCEGTARFARQPSGTTTTVLHSLRDLVLLLAFPPGQHAVDRRAEAVGRRGLPEQGRWDRRIPTGLGHSGYWDDPGVAHEVARIVRVTPAPGAGTGPRPTAGPRATGPLPAVERPRRAPLPRWRPQ